MSHDKIHWVNVTCNATSHIVAVQRHQFEVHAPVWLQEMTYVDLQNEPVDMWTRNVRGLLSGFSNEHVVFGLDDYLPIGPFRFVLFNEAVRIMRANPSLDRFEIGWGASRKPGFIENHHPGGVTYLTYGEETPYKVSCQFSLWRTDSLRRELDRDWTPWQFEVKGSCMAACFSKPIFRWVEESALSERQPGKVNVLGVPPADVDAMVNKGLLDRDKLIYGWKGATVFTPDLPGKKYAQFYK